MVLISLYKSWFIDHSTFSNQGPMLDTTNLLNEHYYKMGLFRVLSLADFYTLSGIVAVEVGIENNNRACQRQMAECRNRKFKPRFPHFPPWHPHPHLTSDQWVTCVMMEKPEFEFKYCRQDCATAPFTDVFRDNFPGGHFDHDQTFGFFADEYGLLGNICC